MSLDVCLRMPAATEPTERQAIFIREDGCTREISREEWNERFPGREPAVATINAGADRVYDGNITHNLNKMAQEAGIYKPLWRPDEIGITKAEQLIEPLTKGLALLRAEPDRFKPLNPPNGWGGYEGLVQFVEEYLAACKRYPTADVSAWR